MSEMSQEEKVKTLCSSNQLGNKVSNERDGKSFWERKMVLSSKRSLTASSLSQQLQQNIQPHTEGHGEKIHPRSTYICNSSLFQRVQKKASSKDNGELKVKDVEKWERTESKQTKNELSGALRAQCHQTSSSTINPKLQLELIQNQMPYLPV